MYAYGYEWPYTTPLSIELTAYKNNLDGNALMHMRNAHDLIWPQDVATYNDWTERRFAAHCEGWKIITLAAGANSGKALQLTEKVCTPTGWITLKHLQEGDVITHPFLGTQTVEKLHPISTREYYRITFDDGVFIDCSEEHLWNVQTKKDRDKQRDFKTLPTLELIPLLSKTLSIPRTKAIEYSTATKLPIDPYFLGVFIGDGSYTSDKTAPSIVLGKAKQSVKNYITSFGHFSSWNSSKNAWYISLKELKKELTELGFFKSYSRDREIPSAYLYSSINDRAQLLAGLIDSDGSADPRAARYEYSTTSQKLHENVLELARSLGFRASVSITEARFEGRHYGKHYRINISDLLNGVALPTKRVFAKPAKKRKHQIIKSIESIGEREGRCITVSNQDGLFVTKDFLVTHNSYDAAKTGLLFWLANPGGRTVLVASTSLTDLDSRIWGYVKRFHQTLAAFELPGILLTSPPPKILLTKKDTIHGMFAVPLQRGTPKKTASTLIGRHPDEGFLAIIDEGTDVSPGFMDAVANWEKSPFFQMIVIGNSASMYDPHGLLSRPKGGWDTVNPDYDTEWETKSGICLYFDCYRSPAIHEKNPEKKAKLAKFLFTTESIEQAILEYGENSEKFWRFTRGFWPAEDSLQTVLTAVMIDKFGAQKRAHWAGRGAVHILAGLDPAMSPDGDECILRFAKLGMDVNGLQVLDFGGEDWIHRIVIQGDSDEPAEYQILNETRRLCFEMGVKPGDLAIDVWGAGSGVGAIFRMNWSADVYEVSSAGPPTETWIGTDRRETAKEAYDRRITELWFSMREFVQGGQIRGLDDISCEQFSTREYGWLGKKYSLETKRDYKERMGKVDNRYRSPDRADAATLILDHARQFYGFLAGAVARSAERDTGFKKWINQKIRDGELSAGYDVGNPRETHPANWQDGFTVSQFDVEEN